MFKKKLAANASILSVVSRSIVEAMEQRVLLSNTLLTGVVIGTEGSYRNHGTVAADAFDSNLNTYFDAPDASGDWAGLNLGTPEVISQISYAPRSGWASRMVGGMFQGSDTADFSSGVVTLYTISSTPTTGVYTTAAVNNTNAFEYVRYLGPTNSYCDVAEVQFYSPSGAATLQSNGTLLINGTSGADTISVNSSASSSTMNPGSVVVQVNGVTQTFTPQGIHSIQINTLDGNDTVSVLEIEDGTGYLPVSIMAGSGNDSINASFNANSSLQMTHSLTIVAGSGNDSVTVAGDFLADSVSAGDGNDQFNTSCNDVGNIESTVTAGNGNDLFSAGSSVNYNQTLVINAGLGTDTVLNTDPDDAVSGTIAGAGFTLGWEQQEITGKVYADLNGDGKYETGEPVAVGAPVEFVNTVSGPFATSTDSNGNYVLDISTDPDYDSTTSGYGYTISNGTNGELLSGINIALRQPLGGNIVGTSGSFQNEGNVVAKAFDGNLSTFFDGPTANGNYAGRDLGTAQVVNAIAYAPRSGWASRMVGGIFQGSNSANFANAVNLYTITSTPQTGVLTYITLGNTAAYRYVRYLSPNGSYGNVAEVQFFNVPTVAPGAVLGANGILTVTGTSSDDYIEVTVDVQAPGEGPEEIDTSVNFVEQSFSFANIKGIVINSGDGNDTIDVDGSYEVTNGPVTYFDPTADLATTINAGNGNDSITTSVSAGVESYEGPSDVINLGSGDDSVDVYQDGTSTVNGGAGSDTVKSSAPDGLGLYVYGGAGDDVVYGGPYTTDFFHGGSGTNTFYEGVDYGQNAVDINLNGPDFSNIQNYYNENGNQNVTVTGTNGNDFIEIDGDAVVVNAGSGNNVIKVYATTAEVTTGNGNNTVLLDTSMSGTVTTGSGNDTIDAADSEGAVTVNGGGGTDTAYAPAAATVSNVEIVNPVLSSPFSGTLLATAGSYNNDGNTAAKAFDGNISTYFDGPTADGDCVGLDLGSYQLIGSIAYAPRAGFASRMVGGFFQASDSPDFSNPVDLFTINSTPASGQFTTYLFTSDDSAGLFARYIRYVAPDNSYGNVAEIEILPPGANPTTKLTGTAIGTAGSYESQGNTIANVFDVNLSTFFDAPSASGDWVGLDLGTAQVVTQVQYAPRSGWADRMVGGQIQASDSPTFSSGVVTLYTITSTPTPGVLTTATFSNSTAYRYYRYLGPANSYCNIAELVFAD
jgi:hypothetical protein